jgi:hypothetical protein
MTAPEAVNYNLNKYPSLYASTSLLNTRLQVFGHLFNTIGNGYRDHDEFAEAYLWTPQIAAMTQNVPLKYIGSEPLYRGYTATEKREAGGFLFDIANNASALHGLYTEEEKQFYPEVTKWIRTNRADEVHKPYPNFIPSYSLLYHLNLGILDDSWLKAGIEYYDYCREYFNSSASVDYHSAWPVNPEKQETLVESYNTAIARSIKGIEDKKEQWAAISKAYGIPYKGDTAQFIQDRWLKEKARIETFIEATIGILQEHLANRQHTTPTL